MQKFTRKWWYCAGGILLLAGLHRQGHAQKANAFAGQQADYVLTVTLDPTLKTLKGEAQITYTNNSADTLLYLYLHLWPNAYRNDKTAFAEQQLLHGNTAFYFSKPEAKGYINQLDFKANGRTATLLDDSVHLDIGKLLLPEPLLPGQKVNLHTPFQVKIPDIFSRMGHSNSYYAITQWYPKIALYDSAGWHTMPYLDQGEYFADFGNYEVSITLPENLTVAATGVLQTQSEISRLNNLKQPITAAAGNINTTKKYIKGKKNPYYNPQAVTVPDKVTGEKTLVYKANRVIDFAWFAHPHFWVKKDTLQLDGREIAIYNYLLPGDTATWKNSITITKKAIRHYSAWVGPYPYPQVSVVADPVTPDNGMEYPMVTNLNSSPGDEETLERLIVHELGHNWFQAILANNERDYPWLDEGLNTYIENKYFEEPEALGSPKKNVSPISIEDWQLEVLVSRRLDQPIATHSENLTYANYGSVAYTKAAQWLKQTEQRIGTTAMQQVMRTYFGQRAFSQVYPAHFLNILRQFAGDSADVALYTTGRIKPVPQVWLPSTLLGGSLKPAKRSFQLLPAAGYNSADKLQAGFLMHNYGSTQKPLEFVMAPMVGLGSTAVNGIAHAAFNIYPQKTKWRHIQVFIGAAKFSTGSTLNEGGDRIYSNYWRFTPGFFAEKKIKNPNSTLRQWAEIKTFMVGERGFALTSPPPPGDTLFFAAKGPVNTMVIPQITLGWENNRALYPYEIKTTLQQVKDLLRFSAEANYFFNYNASGKGLKVRAFAGKIWYLKEATDAVRIDNSRFHFTMYGANGLADYTYSQPFIERGQSADIGGRQIYLRDGAFKYRSDFSAVRPGLSNQGIDFFDNWLAALNLVADVPDKYNPLSLLPVNIPLRLFADFGTSASPWRKQSTHQRFLYSGGVQLTFAKALHIFIPLVQSNVFKEPNSVNDPNRPGGARWWQRTITFTIDAAQLKPNFAGIRPIR